MDGIVLKRSYGGIDNKQYLSFISGPHKSPSENMSLPFFEVEECAKGNSCRGLFYMDNFFGKGVICNITTKEFKLLSPPDTDTSNARFGDSALGYDHRSDDYKVVRNYYPYGGHCRFLDIGILLGLKTEVYSFKDDSWREISGPGPDIHSDPDCGVYIEAEGCCYWPVLVRESDVDSLILSFDFTSEIFSRLYLPPAPEGKHLMHELFDCGGSLGVVGFERHQSDYGYRVGKYFDLWVWTRGSWTKVFDVILVDVGRPLGLRDGHLMFLEGSSDYEGSSSCGRHSHLMTYDWAKGELREYDIFDIPRAMQLLTYVENRVVLPNGEPMNGLESYTSSL